MKDEEFLKGCLQGTVKTAIDLGCSIEELTKRLEAAEKVIRFYADHGNYYYKSMRDVSLKARKYFDKYEKNIVI